MLALRYRSFLLREHIEGARFTQNDLLNAEIQRSTGAVFPFLLKNGTMWGLSGIEKSVLI